jgi:hypothetical protein
MSVTQDDLIEKARNQRSGMIDVYTPLVVAAKADILANLEDQRDLMEDYLFKTGEYIGIQTLIDAYFDCCIGLRTSGSQSTKLTKALIETWTFTSNLVFNSNGTLKSPTSTYITNNNLSLGGTSIYQVVIDIINTIQSERVSAPDYWTATIYTTINTLLANLNNLNNNILTLINDFYNNLSENNYILKKDLFSGFDSGASTFRNNIISHVSSIGVYKSTFETLDDNLTANRTAIDNLLQALEDDLNSWIIEANNRITAISGGNTIFGDPTSAGTINEYRKNILSMLVNYPDGIIQTIISIGSSSTTIDDMIAKQEETLSTYALLTTQYISKPDVISVRFQNQKTSVRVQWSSHLHPNKYKIYRKLVGDVSDNDEWTETYLIDTLNEVDDIDPDILWTQQFYVDATVDPEENYVYRIKAIDDYWSTHGVSCSNSESDQSDVWISGAINPKASTL